MRSRRHLTRAIAFLVLMSYTVSCTGWKAASGVTPAQVVATKHPGYVRITLADRTRIELLKPRVAGDSLYGNLATKVRDKRNPDSRMEKGRPVAVALTDVRRVEWRRVDAAKTSALVVGLALATGAIVGIAVLASLGADGSSGGGYYDGGEEWCPGCCY